VAKFNQSGAFQAVWTLNAATTTVDPSWARVTSLAVSSVGRLAIGGNFSGTVDFNPSANALNRTASGTDGFVLVLGTDGSWQNAVATYDLDVSGFTTTIDATALAFVSATDVCVAGNYTYTATDGAFGDLSWVDERPLSEGAQAFEQRRHLPDVAHGGAGRRRARGRERRFRQEHDLGATGAAELHAIAVCQAVLADGRTVHEGAVARAAVAQHEMAVFAGDLGVLTRDVAADETDVALGATADRQRGFVDGDDAPAEAVVHFKAGLRHGRSPSIIA
jgi:hypothetical protein